MCACGDRSRAAELPLNHTLQLLAVPLLLVGVATVEATVRALVDAAAPVGVAFSVGHQPRNQATVALAGIEDEDKTEGRVRRFDFEWHLTLIHRFVGWVCPVVEMK